MTRIAFNYAVDIRHTFYQPFIACIRYKGRQHGVEGKNAEDAKNNLWNYMNQYYFN